MVEWNVSRACRFLQRKKEHLVCGPDPTVFSEPEERGAVALQVKSQRMRGLFPAASPSISGGSTSMPGWSASSFPSPHYSVSLFLLGVSSGDCWLCSFLRPATPGSCGRIQPARRRGHEHALCSPSCSLLSWVC